MRPAFGDWRSLVAHFVRDEGVGGSNPLSPTKFKTLLNEQGFCIMAREDENLRGQEVRLERSERTLRQQRPAGRATQWRVILYHRPNSKPCSTSRVFCICRPDKRSAIRQYWRYCGWRMDALSGLQAQFHPGVYGVSNPIFDLHFVYKNCAPLPTDC